MKTYTLKVISIFVGAAFIITGCNPLNKMVKNASLVKYEVKPNPLELHGDEVAVTLTGKFPPEYYHKKVKAVVTPVLKYPAEGANQTSKKLKSITLLGEALDGEGQKINYAKGGSFSISDKVTYDKAMETAIVELQVTGTFKKKSKDLPSVKAADGTIITPLLVKGDEKMIIAKDKFQRTKPYSTSADIHYVINSSRVNNKELRQDDIKNVLGLMDSLEAKRITFKNANISAYASPDGEISLNEELANERAASASKAMQNALKKAEAPVGLDDGFYQKAGKGEDWEGFKAEMEKSDIADKDLIIRILEMYSDVNKREKEIKNLAKTYVKVANNILPKLRRSQIKFDGEQSGYTDDELKNLASNNPEKLDLEELLYAAMLTDDLSNQLKVFKSCEKQFPNDWRASNNIGYIYFTQNKLSDAKAQLEKASGISKQSIINNNLGVIARQMGDKEKAKELYDAASGAGSEVAYNKGILNIMEGDYASAVSNMGGSNTFNLALAQLLNGNPDQAMQTVDNSEEKGTAQGFYLKAVAAARKGSADMVASNLKSAIAKDSKLKDKAMKDAEFLKLRDNAAVSALLK
ncbi:MAG: hypothetical protein MRY83_09075 [Flavobacteriales bacterium]|nr:hypothetical protein [Flavobacteriales bacterium]